MMDEINQYSTALFSRQFFHDAVKERKEAICREIQAYDMATVLATPMEKLTEYFDNHFRMTVPILKTEEQYLLEPPRETTSRDTIQDPRWRDEQLTVNRSYIQFTICIPFEGNSNLFGLRPTSYTYNRSKKLRAHLKDNEVRIEYNEMLEGSNEPNLEGIYSADIGMIKQNLQRLELDATVFNRDLTTLINRELTSRKQAAEKSQSIIKTIKVPIKKRDNLPATYSIPAIPKKPAIIQAPKVKTFIPEPALAEAEYENILTILKDMSLAMERSPSTFIRLSEEEIRDFFLIQLNGHYQGNATGETFNGAGKTDILLRYQNENAFIGECKFWKGQKKMTEAIDQLLGYVTWRDTKTSIILFTKQPDLSSVVAKASEAIKAHKNYKAEYRLKSAELSGSETIFGYKYTHPSDPEKEIYLTLMAFQICEPTVKS